eukprot:scaffold65714_cov43-Tisochrysis_lutea.AAC.1
MAARAVVAAARVAQDAQGYKWLRENHSLSREGRCNRHGCSIQSPTRTYASPKGAQKDRN